MKKLLPDITVGVDARPLAYGITGNSRYLAETLRYLLNNKQFRFVLYSNKPLHPVFADITGRVDVTVDVSRGGPGLFWLNFRLPALLKKDRITVFWGTLQLLPLFRLPVPAVVNYHDLNFVSAPDTMSYANYLQHRFLSSFTLKNAAKVFCLSENTRNDILRYNPALENKLVVVYPGVRKVPVKKKYPWKNFILAAGTLEPRKNLGTVVAAWQLLKKEQPDFKPALVIAGRQGWKEEQLTEDLLSGRLERDGIWFIENPDDDLLNYLYKNCLLFLFPSVHEGFGLPLLEALQENRICIASDIPVFHEILEDESDYYASPKDPVAWKTAIINALKKRKRKKVWKANSWSWANTAEKISSGLIAALQEKN